MTEEYSDVAETKLKTIGGFDAQNHIRMAYQTAKSICKPWHDEIEKWRNLYDFNHYQGSALPFETRYEDPTYTNVVDLAVGILLANGLEWRARGWVPNTREMQDATHIEKFLSSVLHINSIRQEIDLVYEVFFNFVRDGVGVLYTIWDDELAEQFRFTTETMDSEQGSRTIYGYSEIPIRTDIIDPSTIYVIPGGKNRWKVVIRAEKMSVFDVESEYGVKIDQFKHLGVLEKMEQEGELIDFWEEVEVQVADYSKGGEIAEKPGVQHGIMYNGQVIQDIEPVFGYDSIPYTINFFKPIGKSKSTEWGKSIVHPLISSVTLLEKSFNRRQRLIDVYSALPPVARTMPGRQINLDASLGTLVQMGVDEEFGFPQWPGSAPDVDQQIALLRAKVQQSGFSDVMMGDGASSVSGYALSQLGDQNRIRLEQPTKHLELFFTIWARKVLKLCKHFASGTALISYGKMKGHDFYDQIFLSDLSQYLVRAELKPEFPNEKSRNHAMATQVRDVVSKRYLMEEYLNVDHPDEINRQRIIEMMEEHPAMVSFAIMRELQQVIDDSDDELEIMAAQTTLEQMKQGMFQGGQGRPQGPPNPMQAPGGMPGANNQLTRQEQGGEPQGQSMADAQAQMANARPTFAE